MCMVSYRIFIFDFNKVVKYDLNDTIRKDKYDERRFVIFTNFIKISNN